jgi:hypothetical protein
MESKIIKFLGFGLNRRQAFQVERITHAQNIKLYKDMIVEC